MQVQVIEGFQGLCDSYINDVVGEELESGFFLAAFINATDDPSVEHELLENACCSHGLIENIIDAGGR